MKSRWITLLGRTGLVILVVGLALAFLSLIPTAPTRMFNAMGGFRVMSREYHTFPFTRVHSPQIGARITVTSNNSVQLYLLATHALELREWAESWIREQFPNLDETQIWSEIHNVSVLHEFLRAHPGALLLNETVNSEHSLDYFPSKVTNGTIVVSNPSLMWADGKIYLTEIATLVPRERVVLPAEALIASGVVLALPWTAQKSAPEKKNVYRMHALSCSKTWHYQSGVGYRETLAESNRPPSLCHSHGGSKCYGDEKKGVVYETNGCASACNENPD